MNKKMVSSVISCAAILSVLAGCGESTVAAMNPDVESKAPYSSSFASSTIVKSEKPNVAWEETIKQAKALLMDKTSFPFVKDLSIQVDENKRRIQFSAVVDDSTEPKVALSYVDTMLRQLNTNATQSDSELTTGTKDSYGGLYNYYSAFIGVAPLSKISESKHWFVYDTIGAKVQTKHEVKLQKEYR